ncbi:MAG: SRPBCC family protein [Crocinitomicaceae bacterium]|nr:SRPBCC family protein [Crocinitomicaceae bacterium]
MSTLQLALLGNGIFSLSSAILIIIFKNKVANWFGLEKSIAFLIIGLCLFYFSYSIFKELKNPNPEAVFYIIVQDLIWVVASVLILTIKPFGISALGNQIIAGVAFVVLFFGIGQSVGLAQTDNVDDKGMKRLNFERVVNATKVETWKAISDVSNYHKVAPNIDDVEIISGEGEGMVRSCSHKSDSWTEVCTQWTEEEQYSFRVNTEAEDYPYPLKYLKGTWKVEEISKDSTKIIMEFEFAYKRKIYNLLIHPFMKSKFNKICKELLDNWQIQLENK